MENQFPGCRTFDTNHAQAITNLITIGNTSKLLRGLIRKCLTPREDRSRELLAKLSRDTMMIEIRHNDSCHTVGTDKFVKSFLLKRNWIDKIHSFGSRKTSRIQFRFNPPIIIVPNRYVGSDSVEIGRRPHGG